MDPRIKEILRRNDLIYSDFKEWINKKNRRATAVYNQLLKSYQLTPDQLPLETRTDLTEFYTETLNVVEENGVDKNIYSFELDNEEEVITLSGVQKVFEVARALGDSDYQYQVRYMFVVLRNKTGMTAPRRVMATKVKETMSIDEENYFRDMMQEIAKEKPTKLLLFRLIKRRQ